MQTGSASQEGQQQQHSPPVNLVFPFSSGQSSSLASCLSFQAREVAEQIQGDQDPFPDLSPLSLYLRLAQNSFIDFPYPLIDYSLLHGSSQLPLISDSHCAKCWGYNDECEKVFRSWH